MGTPVDLGRTHPAIRCNQRPPLGRWGLSGRDAWSVDSLPTRGRYVDSRQGPERTSGVSHYSSGLGVNNCGNGVEAGGLVVAPFINLRHPVAVHHTVPAAMAALWGRRLLVPGCPALSRAINAAITRSMAARTPSRRQPPQRCARPRHSRKRERTENRLTESTGVHLC